MRWYSSLILLAPFTVGLGASPDDAAKQELQQFQGSWQAVSMQFPDGRVATPAELREARLVVTGNAFTFTVMNFTVVGTFTLDPSRTPKAIDVSLADATTPGEKLLGIYQVQGEMRRSCFAPPGGERPKEFPLSGAGYLRFEWKRLSP
jgi:uncharacterized protein (TIGR03067 family)